MQGKSAMRKQIITFLLALSVSLVSYGQVGSATEGLFGVSPKREVRAIWLTTISGLDWPRQKATDAAGIRRQQQELCDILDQLKAARFNTVMLQTRVRSTVIYPSLIEPWDDCLTGRVGRNPGYDPLLFAINECHRRGMELHAWVVAIPGHNFKNASALGARSMNRRVPNLCLKTDQNWILNPGEPGTADYLASICEEIVNNYDVDGIHLDYIRYPEKEIKYNDAATFRKYGNGKRLSQWRADNVTNCVRRVHQTVKMLKPWVRLSCSPIGKYSDLPRQSARGWNARDAVHQDAQAWLREGIMDMLVPMMYFQGQNFYPFLYDWQQSSCDRIIVPGLGVYMMQERNWPLSVIEQECAVTRMSGTQGQAFFRSRFVTEDKKGFYNYLRTGFYSLPALTPALTWESNTSPASPTGLYITQTSDGIRLSWDRLSNGLRANIYRSHSWPVNTGDATNMFYTYLTENAITVTSSLPQSMQPYYVLTIIDRYGNESEPVAFNAPQRTAETLCKGTIRMENGRLLVPVDNKAEYLVFEDMQGRTALSMRYTTGPDLGRLSPGAYTVRAIYKKGKGHRLGTLLWRSK